MAEDQEMQDVRKHILDDSQASENAGTSNHIESDDTYIDEIELSDTSVTFANIMGDIENALDYQDFDDTEQGRQLYFNDGVRRIDYILAWETTSKKMMESETARLTFQDNLKKEFLELEEDKSDPDVHFMKVHAPFDVLRRYAELLKLKVPMKETSELLEYAEQYDQQVVTTASLGQRCWKFLQEFGNKLQVPFLCNQEVFKKMAKKYKCAYTRDKEFIYEFPNELENIFTQGMRSRIVDYILRRTAFGTEDSKAYSFGIKKMINDGFYISCFPLHEGHWKTNTKSNIRKDLYENWAHWTQLLKFQPLHYIKDYFGEKVGLYFAWLGFYTSMLIPASIVGLIVTIYGLVIMGDNYVSNEICESQNITMCPLCDHRCPYWKLSASCSHARVSTIVDNGATVFFAIFMSLWGTLFLEFWKRKQAIIQWKWNLHSEEEEEPPRPEYLAKLANNKKYRKDPITHLKEPYMPFWSRQIPAICFSYSFMLFMVGIAIAAVLGVIAFRVSMLAALQLRKENIIYKNAGIMTTMLSACINLAIIMVLNIIYRRAAFWLTDLESLRTQTEYDNSLTFKLFALQFVNYYSSIIYIAFFKGKFVGRPGKYNTLFGARQEECEPGGCLIELCIQLGIIMAGKQLLQNNLVEILIPKLWKYCMKRWKVAAQKKLPKSPWEKDLLLTEVDTTTLFYEYLEMVLQFGFLTLFVAAFPMGPIFCFINNIIEIRADANKFVTTLKRPTPQIAANIGIWHSVLYGISRIAIVSNFKILLFLRRDSDYLMLLLVHRYLFPLFSFYKNDCSFIKKPIASLKKKSIPQKEPVFFPIRKKRRYFVYLMFAILNTFLLDACNGFLYEKAVILKIGAFIICITSEFIPRLVYRLGYSPDGSLSGYVESSLSIFNTSDFEKAHRPTFNNDTVALCRYRDFRNPPWAENKYNYSEQFWHILAARMAFVVCFENFVVVLTSIIAWLIPDIPAKTKERIRQEAYITQKVIMKEELRRAREDKYLVRDLLQVGNLGKSTSSDKAEEIMNRSFLPPIVKDDDVTT